MSVQSYTRITTGPIDAPSRIVARAAIWKAIRERRAQRGDDDPIEVQERHIETTSLHRVIRVVGKEDQGEVFEVHEGTYMTRVLAAGDEELGALLPPLCVLQLAPLAHLGAAEPMLRGAASSAEGETLFPLPAGQLASAGGDGLAGAPGKDARPEREPTLFVSA